MFKVPNKTKKGLALIPIIIASVILFISTLVFFNLFIKESPFYTLLFQSKEEKLKNKPTIYNLGVNFDKFNPVNNRAGDFLFTKEKRFDNRLFLEFGYFVENNRGKKILPSPTYFLPTGTKVIAVSSGKVVDLRSQPESNDYELLIQPKDAPAWRISYDHLENVRFKKGDFVNTADVVGESGNFTMTELTVFLEGVKPEDIENYCPYMLLDKSVKDKYGQKITQFAKDWEDYIGDSLIYDEKLWIFPGCKLEKINEAQALGGVKN